MIEAVAYILIMLGIRDAKSKRDKVEPAPVSESFDKCKVVSLGGAGRAATNGRVLRIRIPKDNLSLEIGVETATQVANALEALGVKPDGDCIVERDDFKEQA
jgi:hypothetical protein